MTDYYDECYDAEAAPQPPGRRIRFDPTRSAKAETYEHARRHSRRVRWLKFALPAAAVAGIAGFFVAMQLSASGTDPAAVISLAGLNVDSKALVMDKPNISGFEGTRHAYEVAADRATQDLENPKVVTLDNIHATFGVADGVTAEVTSTVGVFNGGNKLLTLKGGIKLTTTNGYRATLRDARINFDGGELTTRRPVEIISADGRIRANSLIVRDRGARILFEGDVHVVITPKDDGPASSAAPPAKGPAAGTVPAGGGNS